MPKKDKKTPKKDKGREPADVVEAVRGAVERTFQATTGGTETARDRGKSLLDEVASAAQRIRESFDDLRVLEDVRGLRAEIEALSKRVAALEQQRAAAEPTPPATSAPPKAARKPAAARRPAAARKPATTAAAKPRATAARGKTAATKPSTGS